MGKARQKQDMSKVTFIGIDETSLRKGHQYVTVVHDLDEKRLLFTTPGKDHQTVERRPCKIQPNTLSPKIQGPEHLDQLGLHRGE